MAILDVRDGNPSDFTKNPDATHTVALEDVSIKFCANPLSRCWDISVDKGKC